MLRLLRDGENFSPHVPREDDGNIQIVTPIPSLHVSSSRLDAASVKRLETRLSTNLLSALAQSMTATEDNEAAPFGNRPGKVGRESLASPTNNIQDLETRLWERLREVLEDPSHVTGSRLSATIDGTCVATSPGEFVSMSELRDLLVHPPRDHDPNLPLNVVVCPASGDVLLLEIFPVYSQPLPVESVAIGLASAVDWSKQIMGWTTCPPHQHDYVQTDGKSNAHWMGISQASALSAIVFRKPKAFGVWYDIFYLDAPEFLEILGGRYARFTWYRD